MKAYAYLNNGLLCYECGWQMSPDVETNLVLINKKPFRPVFYCTNKECSMYEKRLRAKPVEVEMVEIGEEK